MQDHFCWQTQRNPVKLLWKVPTGSELPHAPSPAVVCQELLLAVLSNHSCALLSVSEQMIKAVVQALHKQGVAVAEAEERVAKLTEDMHAVLGESPHGSICTCF